MLNPIHVTIRLAICWITLNATAVTFFAALFTLEESWAALLRRRHRRLYKSAVVIPFSRR